METTEKLELKAELKAAIIQMECLRETILNATNEMTAISAQIDRIKAKVYCRAGQDINGRKVDLNECEARYRQVLNIALRVFGMDRAEYEANIQCRKPKYIEIRQAIMGILYNSYKFSTAPISTTMKKDRTTPYNAIDKHSIDFIFCPAYNRKCTSILTELFPEKNNVGNV